MPPASVYATSRSLPNASRLRSPLDARRGRAFSETCQLTGICVASTGAREAYMPEKATLERARRDKREGKSPSTQAGEFVREEIHHVREGKHGARSSKQAIAIGLSKARRAGVKL